MRVSRSSLINEATALDSKQNRGISHSAPQDVYAGGVRGGAYG
jgi:hypothetical protein